MQLIHQKREVDALQEQFGKGTFRFGHVYGQRRIGKTTLVEIFSKGKRCLSFYAIDTDEWSLLKDLASSSAEQAGLPYPPLFPRLDGLLRGTGRAAVLPCCSIWLISIASLALFRPAIWGLRASLNPLGA